jgi:hypothetical protein
MPDDDDRPSDASSAADASWADVVAPNDISELVADIEAYHRELRRGRRAAWRTRVLSRPGVLPLSIVSIALVLAGVVATLLTVLAPSSRNTAVSPLPLAGGTTASAGSIHGLLPQVKLAEDAQYVMSRQLRPGLVALVPPACGCATVLNQLAGQADEVGYSLDVVLPVEPEAQPLSAALKTGKPRVLVDISAPDHMAQSLYGLAHASRLTVLLVQRDGVIVNRFDNVTGKLPIEAELVTMSQPQASG